MTPKYATFFALTRHFNMFQRLSFTPLIPAITFGLVLACAPGAQAQQAEISTRYIVEVKGVDVMKVNHTIQINGSTYSSAISAKTTGMAKWFSEYKISMGSEGAWSKSKFQPASFNRERKKKGKWRGSTTAWSGGAPAITEDNGGESHAAIADAVNGSTLDPLTLLLKQSLNGSDAPCKGKHRVFDGRDVFDTVLSGKPGSEAGTYDCRATLNYVAGREVDEAKPNPPKSYSYDITLKAVEVPSLGRALWLPEVITGEASGSSFVARATERSVQ